MLPFPEAPGVEHRFVDAGGLRMHVAEAGAGEPLLMLHGWPQHWYQWRRVLPALGERFRVICPDLRGLGWSEAPPRGYEKEQLAADVVALLDALGLERVRLVGHDWGGYVGFLLCLRHPERIERYLALNIIHLWPRSSLRRLGSIWRIAYQLPIASPLGPRVVASQGFVRLILTAGNRRQRVFSDEDIAAYARPLAEPERARASTQIYRTFLLREALPLARGRYRSLRLTVPTLLLFGTGDLAIPTHALQGYEPYAEDMRVELVEGAGHFIAEQRPELVADRALAFF